MARNAAALVIGNEILTGKVPEKNVAFLAKELFALGVRLERVIVCPDVVAVIADDLTALRTGHDIVFTSGGVGPTHDDVTMEAVALSLGRRIIRSSELEELVRGYFGDGTTEGHLRLADVPEGSELISSAETKWPTVLADNVYVFPGVPEMFQRKFASIRDRLRAPAAFISRAIYTHADEFELAPLLNAVTVAHPEVTIGSYLKWGESEFRVKLTFDGTGAGEVDRAVEALLAGLAEERVFRVE